MDEMRKTVLVVDDNEDIREIVGLALRNNGYKVCEAENGQDALEKLGAMQTPPCLLLLDLMVPVMSGPELLQTLRAHNLLSSLPVVVLSAGGKADDAYGAKKFIRKPADPMRILAAVQEICGPP